MFKNKWAIIAAAALAVIVTIDVLWNGWAFVGRLDYTVCAGFWLVVALGLPILIGLIIDAMRWRKHTGSRKKAYDERVKDWEEERGSHYGKPNYNPPRLGDWVENHAFSMFTGWLAILGAVGAVAWGLLGQGYLVSSAYMDRVGTTDVATSYHDRAPWVLADTYASRDQGDDVGDRGRVKHVPEGAGESSRYTTLITGRDALGNVGYSSVREYNLPKTGPIVSNKVSSSCEFPESMGKRWGAPWPNRSLNRDMAFINPLLHFEESDRYAYCADGKPVVVQPLWSYDGLLVVTKVAAGVAVYDEAGLRVLSTDEASKQVVGPIFPQSLAATYRESLPAMGSWGDHVSQRGGYDLSDKDSGDTNAGNTSELGLVSVKGDYTYVTPLTPRGSSQNLTALLAVDARTGKAVIDTTPDLPATSSIENTIRSESVAGDLNWATRWSSGMRVYEMVPGKDGHWVASIGLGQIVNYRADIFPDGTVRVSNTEGSDKPTEPVVVPGTKPLSEMSKEELLDIIEQAAQELRNR